MRIGDEEFSGFSDVVFGSPTEPDAISGEAYDLEGNLVFEIYFYADFQKTVKTFDSKSIDVDHWNKMFSYTLSELEDWDAKLRKPLATWDPRLLSEPGLGDDDLARTDEGRE